MLKFLKRKQKPGAAQAQAQPVQASDASEYEDEDDEAVEAMHAQQEAYLLHVALANSAKEYQRSTGEPRGRRPADVSRASALARRYWSTGM
jgi:hypothetical protein